MRSNLTLHVVILELARARFGKPMRYPLKPIPRWQVRNNSVNIFRDSMPFCLETKMSSLPNKSVIVYWSPGVKDLLNLYLTRNCLFLPHITNAAMSPNKHEWKHPSEIGHRCPSGPGALKSTPLDPEPSSSCSAPTQLPPHHSSKRSARAALRTSLSCALHRLCSAIAAEPSPNPTQP